MDATYTTPLLFLDSHPISNFRLPNFATSSLSRSGDFGLQSDKIKLRCTDLDLTVISEIRAVCDGDLGETTMPAKKLLEIVKQLKEDEIVLKIADGICTIEDGNAEFQMHCLPADDFPKTPEVVNPVSVKIIQTHLKELIRRSQYAVSKDGIRYILQGINFELDGVNAKAVGTDGRRLGLTEDNENNANADNKSPVKFVLPQKTGSELYRLASDNDGVAELLCGKENISITLKPRRLYSDEEEGLEPKPAIITTIISKLLEGEYPEYTQLFSDERKNVLKVYRDDFLEIVKRVSLLASDRDAGIIFRFADGKMHLSARTEDLGNVKDWIEVDYEGEGLTLKLASGYLIDCLSAFPNGQIQMKMIDDNESVLFESPENRHIIMPMRID